MFFGAGMTTSFHEGIRQWIATAVLGRLHGPHKPLARPIRSLVAHIANAAEAANFSRLTFVSDHE
jgi:hypothetical protein